MQPQLLSKILTALNKVVCLLGFDMTGIFDTRVVVINDNFSLWNDVGQPFRPEEPNMTKPPLQVLAVIEGKSEKIRFRISHVLGKYIGLNIKLSTRIITSHFSHFLSMAGLESGHSAPFSKSGQEFWDPPYL